MISKLLTSKSLKSLSINDLSIGKKLLKKPCFQTKKYLHIWQRIVDLLWFCSYWRSTGNMLYYKLLIGWWDTSKTLPVKGFRVVHNFFILGVLFVPIGDWNSTPLKKYPFGIISFACTYRGLKRQEQKRQVFVRKPFCLYL